MKGGWLNNSMAELANEKAKPSACPKAEGSLPPGWSAHESRSNPGHFYFFNCHTGATTWNRSQVTSGQVAAPVAKLNDETSKVSETIPMQKAAEDDQKGIANNNTSLGVEEITKITQLEELLQKTKEEIQARNLGLTKETAPSCVPGKSATMGLSSGLRSRKKSDLESRSGFSGVAPVKVVGEELDAQKQQDFSETMPVTCNQTKARSLNCVNCPPSKFSTKLPLRRVNKNLAFFDQMYVNWMFLPIYCKSFPAKYTFHI